MELQDRELRMEIVRLVLGAGVQGTEAAFLAADLWAFVEGRVPARPAQAAGNGWRETEDRDEETSAPPQSADIMHSHAIPCIPVPPEVEPPAPAAEPPSYDRAQGCQAASTSRGRKGRVWTAEEKTRFSAMYEGGEPYKSIADVFGLPVGSVWRTGAGWGLSRPGKASEDQKLVVERKLPPDLQAAIDWLRSHGHDVREAARTGYWRCTGAEWTAEQLIDLRRQIEAKGVNLCPPAYVGEVAGAERLPVIARQPPDDDTRRDKALAVLRRGRASPLSLARSLGVDFRRPLARVMRPLIVSGQVVKSEIKGRVFYELAGGDHD